VSSSHLASPNITNTLRSVFGVWRFWVMVVCVIPVAYASGILVWLYMLSFAITPNGSIAYVGAALQTVVSVLISVRFVKFSQESRARRKAGLAPRPVSFRIFPFVAAMLCFQAPISPIGLHLIDPQTSTTIWVKIATEWRHRELHF
jgi:hypothetical protein